MAARHRRDVLGEIRDRLAAGQPVAVVSTQLIEAGVDLDFPVVFRAWAPADSLQQAAGRCNRSARMAEGRVAIFDPDDGGHPADSSYKAALHATGSYFGPDLADPDALAALEKYYNERYTRQNLDASGPGARIQRLRARLDFPEVARAFQMIEEHTVPVAVEYGGEEARAEVRDLADRLRSPGPLQAGEARLLLRRLQPYLATLPAVAGPQGRGRRVRGAGHRRPAAVARPLSPAAGNRPGRAARTASGGGVGVVIASQAEPGPGCPASGHGRRRSETRRFPRHDPGRWLPQAPAAASLSRTRRVARPRRRWQMAPYDAATAAASGTAEFRGMGPHVTAPSAVAPATQGRCGPVVQS